MAPTATPTTGAEARSVIDAADKISAILNPESQDHPQEEDAPAETTQPDEPVYDEATGRYRDPATNKFVKGPESETEESQELSEEDAPDPKEEGADAEDSEEPDEDGTEELADTVEGLAEQLGMDPEEFISSVKATINIDGEEEQVTLSELVRGHFREADYTRKTSALADQRREVEDLQSAIEKQRDEFSSKLEPMLQQLEQYVNIDEQYLNQLAAEGRSDEWFQYKVAADQRAKEFQQAQEAKQKIEKEKAEEQQQKLRQEVAKNEQRLMELRPDWAKDPDKGKKELAAIRGHLKERGFNPRDVDSLFHAETIDMAHDAMRYHQLQKAKPDKLGKLKSVPRKVTRPGPAKAKEDPKKKVRRENLNRLRQTGNYRDAAPLIKDIAGLS